MTVKGGEAARIPSIVVFSGVTFGQRVRIRLFIRTLFCHNISRFETNPIYCELYALTNTNILHKVISKNNERGQGLVNKKTVALTVEQYHEIIDTMKLGVTGCRSNNRIATALVIEANLGIRISDILKLRLSDILKDGNRYRLNITEQKTGKQRVFTVPTEIYNYIKIYCLENSIKSHEIIFPITDRAVQKHLKVVCDYLGYEGISTHSFRKFFATQIYINNNFNIVLVQQLLQHSSTGVTQKYIGIQPKEIEDALQKHTCLI